MIGSENVTFKTVDAQIENVHSGEDRKTMDVCEITYPDGKVVAYPADHVSPEDGRKYSEIYGGKYQAFKAGEPDADRVAQLEREIAEREAELKTLTTPATHWSAKDDKRVKENLGYGKVGDAANPQQARAGAETRDHKTDKIDQPVTLGKTDKPAKHKARG